MRGAKHGFVHWSPRHHHKHGLRFKPGSDMANSEFLHRSKLCKYMRKNMEDPSYKNKEFCLHSDKNKFQATLDVRQYKPEEITIKITDNNTVDIEGKHEENSDENGFVSKQFLRRFTVPENYDMEKLESKLSPDGFLLVVAPSQRENGVEYREIPIIRS